MLLGSRAWAKRVSIALAKSFAKPKVQALNSLVYRSMIYIYIYAHLYILLDVHISLHIPVEPFYALSFFPRPGVKEMSAKSWKAAKASIERVADFCLKGKVEDYAWLL